MLAVVVVAFVRAQNGVRLRRPVQCHRGEKARRNRSTDGGMNPYLSLRVERIDGALPDRLLSTVDDVCFLWSCFLFLLSFVVGEINGFLLLVLRVMPYQVRTVYCVCVCVEALCQNHRMYQ